MADFKYDIRAMLRKFGVVTVMDVEAYQTERFAASVEKKPDGSQEAYDKGEWDALATFNVLDENRAVKENGVKAPLFTLDTLKIANINQEGPTKTITGGQNADTLLKYGKTLTIEMQDALGRYDVLDQMYGVNFSANHQFASFTDRFPKELTLVGTTFVIDQATGAKQPIKIVIPVFLGDGVINLTQDAEGDASVFDLNGNILKFEGGGTGASQYATGEERFDDDHEVKYDAEGKIQSGWDGVIYGAGADNEFYFMTTLDGFDQVKKRGYREAYLATDIPGNE